MKIRCEIVLHLDTEDRNFPEEFKGLPIKKLEEEMRKGFIEVALDGQTLEEVNEGLAKFKVTKRK